MYLLMCVAPFYMDNVTGILQPGESSVTACDMPAACLVIFDPVKRTRQRERNS